MSVSVKKTGVVNGHFFTEENQFGKAGSFTNDINNNLLSGIIDVVKDKSGVISSVNTLGLIPSDTIKSLAGQILCLSYEVCTSGDRYSTEQGETAWNQTRYGVHGSCTIDGSANYPFANYLNYSGDATRLYMLWRVPSGTTYGNLTIANQTYDKPASTNNAVWYLRNLKLELSDHPTPYVLSDYNVVGDSALSFNDFIEI